MAIAWRRLADVPTADARPWLIVTTRNLLLAERRSEPETGRQPLGEIDLEAPAEQLPSELDLDPDLARGLRVLAEKDREALLLIAWDDLTPALAAASLGDLPDGIPSAATSRSAPAQRSPDRAGLDEARLSTSTELEADMKDDRLMRRLRAARPVAAEPGDHASLFARIVAEPGDPRLVQAPHERSSRLLAGNGPVAVADASASSRGQHARAGGRRRGARARPGRVRGPAGVCRHEGRRWLGAGAAEPDPERFPR